MATGTPSAAKLAVKEVATAGFHHNGSSDGHLGTCLKLLQSRSISACNKRPVSLRVCSRDEQSIEQRTLAHQQALDVFCVDLEQNSLWYPHPFQHRRRLHAEKLKSSCDDASREDRKPQRGLTVDLRSSACCSSRGLIALGCTALW